ncbi:hypothetical protein ABAZ39_07140 [Azospirillum argentinense]|uniref:Uncharacterized protein n=1 Tax=Azospirillum argentinense TaxID=2970906 RepID=A0A060DG11_9PROT|nr:hypothetical protein [Azospirillum argentinense]AIB11777.1 hypothetical protein ABAZ39_07140 [Azospirillum argentinense]EZQ09751.1 hypothetical protein ABAZ39_08560 [Azospirillum argentinense]
MKESRSELVWQIVQCGIAIVIGCAVYWQMTVDEVENEKARLFGSLLFGVGGSYLLMKLYVLIRYGRKAAKSMSWKP